MRKPARLIIRRANLRAKPADAPERPRRPAPTAPPDVWRLVDCLRRRPAGERTACEVNTTLTIRGQSALRANRIRPGVERQASGDKPARILRWCPSTSPTRQASRSRANPERAASTCRSNPASRPAASPGGAQQRPAAGLPRAGQDGRAADPRRRRRQIGDGAVLAARRRSGARRLLQATGQIAGAVAAPRLNSVVFLQR